MKVLHLCLASFYIDNYSYQENLLPKYHKKMGLDVEIIASLTTFDENGNYATLDYGHIGYVNEHGISVTRLDYKKGIINKKLRRYIGTFDTIKKAKPDIIFVHGCQFLDMIEVVKYLKENPQVKVYVDNHADFSNSATNIVSKHILHKRIWRYCAHLIEPYTEKFYGVLPARVNFLEDIYRIPKEKTELLLMGADDEKIIALDDYKLKQNFREEYNISDADFLIVTGGKIDKAKLQVLNLMKVITEMNNTNIKLIVYGSIIPEMKEEANKYFENESISYIGWIDDTISYKLFSAANLIVFPGRHSVYWEQVAALGIPLLVKYWEGTQHIDFGGNCDFLNDDSIDELREKLLIIIYNRKHYTRMLEQAQSDKRVMFYYSEIAKKSISV